MPLMVDSIPFGFGGFAPMFTGFPGMGYASRYAGNNARSILGGRRPCLNATTTAIAAAPLFMRLAFGDASAGQGFIDAGDAYTLELDVPGVAPEDLKINLHVGVLTVTGRRKFAAAAAAHDDDADRDGDDADNSNGRARQRQHQQHHHRGRYYYAQYGGRGRGAAVATSCSGAVRGIGPSSAEFRRAFAVPDDADADRADASLANGVLEVTLPKRAPSPAPEPKTIPVTVRGDAAAAPAPSDKEAHHTAAAAAADAPADDAAAAPVDNGEVVNATPDEDGVIEDVPAGEEDDNGAATAAVEGDAEAPVDAEAWTSVEKADA